MKKMFFLFLLISALPINAVNKSLVHKLLALGISALITSYGGISSLEDHVQTRIIQIDKTQEEQQAPFSFDEKQLSSFSTTPFLNQPNNIPFSKKWCTSKIGTSENCNLEEDRFKTMCHKLCVPNSKKICYFKEICKQTYVDWHRALVIISGNLLLLGVVFYYWAYT